VTNDSEVALLWFCLHCGNVQQSPWKPTHCLICKDPTNSKMKEIRLDG